MHVVMDIENKNKKAGGNCVCKLPDYREYNTTNHNGPKWTTKMEWNGPEFKLRNS